MTTRREVLRGGAAALILGTFKLRLKPRFRVTGRISFITPMQDGSVLVGYKGIERYAPGYVYCPHPPFPFTKVIDFPHPRTAHMKPSDFVKENNLARFLHLRQGNAFYYVRHLTENRLYMFPVSLADVGEATLGATEKALTLMRYIRLAIHDGTMVLKVAALPEPA